MRHESVILKPKHDRPIDVLTCSIIKEISNAATDLELNIFLVGATARIILLENVFGLQTGRATRDIDFAFMVESWGQYQAIKDRLISTARFEESEHAGQRLLYKPVSGNHKFVVDLIPFGGLESSPNTIAWLPDMSIIMNVAGYRDALTSAVPVEVEPGTTILIASIPGMSVLNFLLGLTVDAKIQKTPWTLLHCSSNTTRLVIRTGSTKTQLQH